MQQTMITFQMSRIQLRVHQDHVNTNHVCGYDVETMRDEAAHNH